MLCSFEVWHLPSSAMWKSYLDNSVTIGDSCLRFLGTKDEEKGKYLIHTVTSS